MPAESEQSANEFFKEILVKGNTDGRNFGYVCTPRLLAEYMLSLRRNHGRSLDPACGAGLGAFEFGIPDIVGIELSDRATRAIHMDFFEYLDTEKFDTIICNPPYVMARDILPETRSLFDTHLLDARANLYLHFIEKCVRHLTVGGELIFVNPREFLHATSAVRLNTWLVSQGAITHCVDLAGERVFPDATPDVVVWRFVRGAPQGFVDTPTPRPLVANAGVLRFPAGAYPLNLRDIGTVAVGAVSGADTAFEHADGRPFVCSATERDGALRKMLWPGPHPHPHLLQHKHRLLARGIRCFTEADWWYWGRGFPDTRAPRVYVNTKTRAAAPFFLSECTAFDGSVLALFPRHTGDMPVLRDALNAVDWGDLGFRRADGRCVFGQRSLQNAPLPATFAAFQ